MSEPPTFRCLIYTRKSSDEGLDQAFNSLEAQREAAEAYIRSQAAEGWVLIPDRFDDGGFSGGSLERPALDRVMKLVRDAQVDIIVIYKIDRLTRSLTDFAHLAEMFDKYGVSFVSVTQQFSTSDSTGRLMLNVLLSFAQFEREITAERIRDKIAASKRRGMWMGGPIPMGYDLHHRKLVVNNREASAIRRIFELYLEEPSAPALLKRLKIEEIRTQARTSANGNASGGRWFTRGHIYKLLSNPIYIGKIPHKGVVHWGEHQAIIDDRIWAAVQEKLGLNTREKIKRRRQALPDAPLLADLLFSKAGNRMIAVSATKAGRRYRYYAEVLPDRAIWSHTTSAALRDPDDLGTALSAGFGAPRPTKCPKVLRLPAVELEAAVFGALKAFLIEHQIAPGDQLLLIRSLATRVTVSQRRAAIEVDLAALREAAARDQPAISAPVEGPSATLDVSLTFRRRGPQFKLAVERQSTAPSIEDVARAFDWFERLSDGRANSIAEIAASDGFTSRDVSRVLPLASLPPRFVAAMFAGREPAEISYDRPIWRGRSPLRWLAAFDTHEGPLVAPPF